MEEGLLVLISSRFLLSLSTLLGVINLVFICEHADACRVNKKSRNPFVQKRIQRYQKWILHIGITILILLVIVYVIDKAIRPHIIGPILLYKIPIPFLLWWTSYKLSSKRIRVLKKLRERRRRKKLSV